MGRFGDPKRDDVPLFVIPQPFRHKFRHSAPQLAVVTLDPRIRAQGQEQRNEGAAWAVFVVPHGDDGSTKKSKPFALFSSLFRDRAPRHPPTPRETNLRRQRKLGARGMWSGDVRVSLFAVNIDRKRRNR